MERQKVTTPYGKGEVNEELDEAIQVELKNPHKEGNREYNLWIFNKSEVKYD